MIISSAKTLVDTLVKQARGLVQDVVTHPDRIEGDVTGHDDSRLDRLLYQVFNIVEIQLFGPSAQPDGIYRLRSRVTGRF